MFLFNAYRRTGTIGFPIDDAYIYASYARNAASGQFFQYNAGQVSGGVTSVGWYLILTTFYLPLSAAGLNHISELSFRNGLLVSAYLAGLTSLLASLLAFGALARRFFGPGIAALLLLAFLNDRPLLWGAVSGLEVSFSSALLLAALVAFLAHRSWVRAVAGGVIVGLLVWSRPELGTVTAALIAWKWGLYVAGRVSWPGDTPGVDSAWRRVSIGEAVVFSLLAVSLTAALPALLSWQTGLPLPSTFYAKVTTEWPTFSSLLYYRPVSLLLSIGDWSRLGLVGLLICALMGVRAQRLEPVLLASLVVAFFVGKVLLAPAVGEVYRYVSMLGPIAILSMGFLFVFIVGPDAINVEPLRKDWLTLIIVAAVVAATAFETWFFVVHDYTWHVRNINDSAVAMAQFFRGQKDDSPVASEPIGAVGLLSGRRTIDIVGLTTPPMLGHLGDWDFTRRFLLDHGARYLVYYPALFPSGSPPTWAHPVATFSIENNLMAGPSPLVVYEIE